ncbi:MAG: hypothetical protein WDW36_001698 [Sanguina aurantia]
MYSNQVAQQAHEQNRKYELKTAQRQRAVNWLLNILSVASIVVFVVGLYLNDWALAALEDNPLVGMDLAGLLRMGATSTPKISQDLQYWRLVSSLFISAGVLHMWANVSTLWTYGLFLSKFLAAKYLVLVFFSSGVAGVLVSSNLGVSFVTCAASAPAFGMVGGACSALILHRRQLASPCYSTLVIAATLALNLFIGATPFVDNVANVSGFVLGALLVASLLLIQDEESSSPDRPRRELCLQFSAAAMMAAAAGVIVMGLVGLNANLPAGGCCDQWVCAPGPLWNCNAARIRPTDCTYSSFYNGSLSVTCPQV